MTSQYINGRWEKGGGKSLESIDPSTGKVIWRGEEATERELHFAIESAKAAFREWSQKEVKERIYHVEQFGEQLHQRREEVAERISQEMGKPFWESLLEVDSVKSKIALSIKAASERTGTVEQHIAGANLITRHRPQGIVAVLSPINFPVHLPSSHMIPALLAGNCVLFKPSEQTPATGELLVQCWQEAGLCSGQLALLQGGGEVGRAIASHPKVKALIFTGSARTGQLLAKQFSATPERLLALEMGGNNPVVVSHVEDLPAAAYQVIQSAFLTSGQRCTCARRLILVRNESNQRLLSMIVEMARSLRIGRYTEMPEPFMGPLVSKEAAIQLLKGQERLVELGGRPLLPATLLKAETAFVSPGIIDLTPLSIPPDEELFGPLLQLVWVDSFEEAIQEANRTAYGLSAALLSDNRHEWERFVQLVWAGVINWNRATTGASGAAPFGGLGRSGNMRPAGYYAADLCAHPVASFESPELTLPENLTPGIEL